MNAYIIAAGAFPFLNDTYLNEVLSNVFNFYGHSGCYCVAWMSVMNSAICAFLVGPLAGSPSPPERQPAKRARTVPAKATDHTRLSPPRKVRGRLSELPTMPMDILFEVCNMRLVIFATPVKHGNCSDFCSSPSLGPAFGQSREQGFSWGALVSQFFVFVERMLEALWRSPFSLGYVAPGMDPFALWRRLLLRE